LIGAQLKRADEIARDVIGLDGEIFHGSGQWFGTP
jgi:hypothetical protein